MQRIGTVDGLFIPGNPATQTPGTTVTAAWLNTIQEEMARVVEGLGGELNPANDGQLFALLTAAFTSKSGFTAGGTADEITGTLFPAITAYGAKLRVTTTPPGANTSTTPTLNLNGLGAKTIKKRDSSGGKVALVGGDFNASGPFDFEYDGADFILLNPDISRFATQVGVQAQTHVAFTTAGTSTAFTLAPAPALTALAAGQRFRVKFHATAGATPTLSISGLAAKPLKKYNGLGVKEEVSGSSIIINMLTDVEYDGTDYVVMDQLPGVFTASLAATGYQKFPSGLIIQWGRKALGVGAASYIADVTFPITFPTSCAAFVASIGVSATDLDANSYRTARQAVAPGSPGISGCEMQAFYDNLTEAARDIFWYAIGY